MKNTRKKIIQKAKEYLAVLGICASVASPLVGIGYIAHKTRQEFSQEVQEYTKQISEKYPELNLDDYHFTVMCRANEKIYSGLELGILIYEASVDPFINPDLSFSISEDGEITQQDLSLSEKRNSLRSYASYNNYIVIDSLGNKIDLDCSDSGNILDDSGQEHPTIYFNFDW